MGSTDSRTRSAPPPTASDHGNCDLAWKARRENLDNSRKRRRSRARLTLASRRSRPSRERITVARDSRSKRRRGTTEGSEARRGRLGRAMLPGRPPANAVSCTREMKKQETRKKTHQTPASYFLPLLPFSSVYLRALCGSFFPVLRISFPASCPTPGHSQAQSYAMPSAPLTGGAVFATPSPTGTARRRSTAPSCPARERPRPGRLAEGEGQPKPFLRPCANKVGLAYIATAHRHSPQPHTIRGNNPRVPWPQWES